MYLINSNLKFKQVNRDRLFYERFHYSIGFYLSEVSCLRELNHEYIDTIIARRRQWREISLQRWSQGFPNKNILTRKPKDISDDTVKNLHELTDLLLNSGVEFKLITSVSTAWLYTNNLKLINQVDQLSFIQSKTYSQAQVTRPKDTIRLKNPKYQHRAYFGSHKLTLEEKQNLANFFRNQQDYVRISPSLETFFKLSFHRTQDYFFFDYSEDSWTLMLSLIRPGLIRKTLDIIPR